MISRSPAVSEQTVRERGQILLTGVTLDELQFLKKLEDQDKIGLRVARHKDDIVLLTRMHCGVVQVGSRRIFIEPKVPTKSLLFFVESPSSLPAFKFLAATHYPRARNFMKFF